MNNFSEKVNFIGFLVDLILDQPARPFEIIEAEVRAPGIEIKKMLREVAG